MIKIPLILFALFLIMFAEIVQKSGEKSLTISNTVLKVSYTQEKEPLN